MIIKEDKRFNEKVYIIKLKSGMEVHMLPKDHDYFSTYVELSFPFGANHLSYLNNEVQMNYPYGSAHFLEHKIFAMPDGDQFIKFSNIGVDANAMTSYQQTSYLFNATSHVEKALTLLLEMLDTPYFTDQNIESEEKIIAEELKMYLDDVETKMYQQLMQQMYKNHPFKSDIGGSIESIKDINKDVLTDMFNHFYHQSNRLIVIAGKIDVKKMVEYFKKYDQHKKVKIPKIIYPNEPKGVLVKRHIEKNDVSIDKLMIGFKFGAKYKTGIEQIKNEMTHTLLFNLLLGNTSNLYHDLIKKQLINHNFYASATFENHYAHYVIYGDTKDPEFLESYIFDKLKKAKEELLDEKSFKRYLKVYIGQFVFALNSIEHKAYLYGKYYHKHTHLFDVVDTIKSITYQDLINAYESFIKSPHSTLIYKKG